MQNYDLNKLRQENTLVMKMLNTTLIPNSSKLSKKTEELALNLPIRTKTTNIGVKSKVQEALRKYDFTSMHKKSILKDVDPGEALK